MTPPTRSTTPSRRSTSRLAIPERLPSLNLAVLTSKAALDGQEYRDLLMMRLEERLKEADPDLENAQEHLNLLAEVLDQEPREAGRSHLQVAHSLLGGKVGQLLDNLVGRQGEEVRLQPLEAQESQEAGRLPVGELVLELAELAQARYHPDQ